MPAEMTSFQVLAEILSSWVTRTLGYAVLYVSMRAWRASASPGATHQDNTVRSLADELVEPSGLLWSFVPLDSELHPRADNAKQSESAEALAKVLLMSLPSGS